VGLTFQGYKKIGIAVAKIPGNASAGPFKDSMRSDVSVAALSDPPVANWEQTFRHTIHAVVLIGDASEAAVVKIRAEIDALMTAHVKLLGVEKGSGQKNGHGDGIEHFGYIDGRSQPIFLTEDIADERHKMDGTTVWNPAFGLGLGLGRVLVADSAAPDPTKQFGSFFCLSQARAERARVRKAENDFATALGLAGEDPKRAGAMIVGRFGDGTPLTTQRVDGAHSPIMNDSDYDSDDVAGKCPPSTGTSARPTRVGRAASSRRATNGFTSWPRRGQTYGNRTDNPTDESLPLSSRPTTGIGAPGLDQVIGQGTRPTAVSALNWGGKDSKPLSAAPQAVTLEGGEYFFMPSLAFLRSL
jgi:deferrochelatase/peroxidase EfeB